MWALGGLVRGLQKLSFRAFSGRRSSLTHGATVAKLPDAKPLKCVGCFSPLAKSNSSGYLVLAGILAFYAVKTC